MKPRIIIILLILFLTQSAHASAKVSMAVSRREETAFVPLNYRETHVELARIYNTGDTPLTLVLVWTQTGGNLPGTVVPDSLVLEPNTTRLCYLVFNASAVGGLMGVMEVKAVQEEVELNQSGAGGTVIPAFEVEMTVTVAEPPVMEVELGGGGGPSGASATWSLAILNVGPEAADGLLSWRVQAPEWLRLSMDNGVGPATVEVTLSPSIAPGAYEGELLVESNVRSERIPLTAVVEEPIEEPEDPPEENTTTPIPEPEEEPPINSEPDQPDSGVNWTPIILVGLFVTGALLRFRGRGSEGAEDEVFTELETRMEEPSVFTELEEKINEEE